MSKVFAFKRLIFLFATLLAINTFANKQQLDSLERCYINSSSPEEKVRIFDEIFTITYNSDAEKSLKIATEFRKNIASYSIDTDLKSLNYLGIAYMNMNQYDSAFYYFNALLLKGIEHNDSIYLSKAYNNLGALNFNMGDYDNAVFYTQKATIIDEKLGDIESSVINSINISALYSALGMIDSAEFYVLQAVDIAKIHNDLSLLGTAYLNMAGVLYKTENFEDSESASWLAIENGLKSDNFDIVSMAYRNLAMIFQKKNKFADALGFDYKSMEYAIKCSSLENQLNAQRGIAYSYEKLKRYEEALSSYKSYIALKDSIDEVENEKLTLELKEKYLSEQTKIENQILTQNGKIKDLEIEKGAVQIRNSRIIIISSILGLVLLVMLAFVLYNRNLIKQKANKKLQNAYAIIQEKNLDILASIEYAGKIQEALLPAKENKEVFEDSFFLLKPKDIVSGDFIWYTQVNHLKIIAVVDCTGHGVPGAFMSMIGNTFLHQIINEKGITKPDTILNELRSKVVLALNQKGEGVNRKDGMDMTLCTIDQTKQTMQFAGANNPIYFFSNNELIELKGDKQPVGYFESAEKPFSCVTINFQKGDSVYLFSDGFVDQFGGPKGKKFKHKQLQDSLKKMQAKAMAEQKAELINIFDNWRGELEQVDDVCMVGIRF